MCGTAHPIACEDAQTDEGRSAEPGVRLGEGAKPLAIDFGHRGLGAFEAQERWESHNFRGHDHYVCLQGQKQGSPGGRLLPRRHGGH